MLPDLSPPLQHPSSDVSVVTSLRVKQGRLHTIRRNEFSFLPSPLL